MSAPIIAPNRVLPTLNADGTRRKIRPKHSPGRWYWRRFAVAWGLIVTFVAIPFIHMNGKPLILLDIPAREFTLFGHTFLPTDGVLLMLLLLAIFTGIFWLTALVGRAWCGWGCPQTVYMEYVFRPIERLIEGDRNAQLRLDARGPNLRRLLKNFVFGVVSVLVANVFLAYFVGVSALSRWIGQSPVEHPLPFLVMAGTALLVYLDFGWFREQMCTVACPYARLQSVLLDKRSLIVGYDIRRGEPRSRGKSTPGSGDCIDCSACVTTCPTGIDIREGLQLECIACAQCVDACDRIMDRVNKPRGLIRFGSQAGLQEGASLPLLRPRVVIYPVILTALLALLVIIGQGRGSAEVTVLRGVGAPFMQDSRGVRNQLRVKVANRSSADQAYSIELLDLPDAQLIAPENPLHVRRGKQATTSVFVIAPPSAFNAGQRAIRIRVSDGAGLSEVITYKLLGPHTKAR